MMKSDEKIVVGLIEQVTLRGNDKQEKKVAARIDTGAEKSSIDSILAAELRLGPITKRRIISSVHGRMLRPVMEATISVAGKEMTAEFTIADRSTMRYKVLVGQNILKKGFLIDPSR